MKNDDITIGGIICGLIVAVLIALYFAWFSTDPGACIGATICYGTIILVITLIFAVIIGFFRVWEDIFRELFKK